MDTNSLIFLFIGIAISAAIFALLVFLFPQIAERRADKTAAPPVEPAALVPAESATEMPAQSTAEAPVVAAAAKPAEKTAEQLLAPFLFYGICTAYRTAERAMFDGYPMMWGTDKKRIADSAYDVLPAQVEDRETSALKSEVSKEQFAEMLQRAFDAFDQFCKENQAFFDQQFDAWKQEHPRP